MSRPELTAAVQRIGDRWSPVILDALAAGPQRFGEISEQLDGIAPNILTKRLRQLEADGIISSSAYSDRPVRLAYELTDSGRDLTNALELLAAWGSRHHDDTDTAIHRACGSTLEVRLWCPTCGDLVDGADATDDVHL